MSETSTTEYRVLDAYRFFAALMVALGHFGGSFALGLESFTPYGVRFNLFVDFFFILSGFVIALNYTGRVANASDYGDFLWRRIARLWPLHLLVLAILCAAAFIGYLANYRFTDAETYEMVGLLWNVFLLQAWGPVWHQSFNVPAWSISAELFVYMLFPIFAWQVRRFPIWASLGLIIFIVLIESYWRQAAGLRAWHQATYDLGILRAVPSFLLGVVIHRAATTNTLPFQIRWPVAHAVFGAALAALQLNMPSELIIALFGLFVFAAVKAEQSQAESWFSVAPFRRLGQASYALYMIHMPMMTFALILVRPTIGTGGWAGWSVALLLLAAATILALWLYENFENPWRHKLNSMSPFRTSQPRIRASQPT
jgi:peptidoglycan/LPS O-acetylase OafA/YrhL